MTIKARLCVYKVEKTVGAERVFLSPVYSEDPTSPNYSYSKYTPTGDVNLFISNEAVFGQFVPGAVFDVDFTPYVAE